MTKLNQIIAIEKGVKAKAERTLTDAYQLIQKGPLLEGLERTYTPKDDDGEQLPGESNRVQVIVEDLLASMLADIARGIDVSATKDEANTAARGTIAIDDLVLVGDVPVTTLLPLEKKIAELKVFIDKLPVLDPAIRWTIDENTGIQRSEVVETVRSKKIPRNHVVAPATDKHPAQVQVWQEDVQAGTWATTKFSGAIPATRKRALQFRVEAVLEAIKRAREEANEAIVHDVKVADALLQFIFIR